LRFRCMSPPETRMALTAGLQDLQEVSVVPIDLVNFSGSRLWWLEERHGADNT